MKTYSFLLFTTALLFSVSLSAQTPPVPVDTSRIAQADSLMVTDTLAQDWTTRSPLTEDELQRRADNRAEVEDMKKRFRRFHQEAATQNEEEQTAQEDEDYLWSESEAGGQVISTKRTQETPASENPEDLRMEISRNLQEGRNPNAAVPASPVLPAYDSRDAEIPQEYNMPIIAKQPDLSPAQLETTIQSSFQAKGNSTDDWQAKVGGEKMPLANPTSGAPLQAGQVITLEGVRFLPNGSEIQPAAQQILNQWGVLLKTYPTLTIEVRSHTFGVADAITAQQITRERAQNILDYWLTQGVGIQQLGFRGYGNLSPLVPSSAHLAQQKNERIELIILELPDR